MPACLLDGNVWLAAAFAAHPAHRAARRVLQEASADEPALWCRATQQSFLRLASTPVSTAAYGVAKATNADAWVALEAFRSLPQVDVIDETPELAHRWRQLPRSPALARLGEGGGRARLRAGTPPLAD